MKPEDFEQQLKRQTIRPMPTEWRPPILDAARKAGLPPMAHSAPSRWRELFWPCPQAWAGLAAVWVIILLLNFSASDDRVPVAMAKAPPPDAQILTAGTTEQNLLAQILGENETPVAERPKSILSRPRSERPRDSFVV